MCHAIADTAGSFLGVMLFGWKLVRAGRAMALPEIGQLVDDWVEEGLLMTCPHGRRTSFRLSTDELDRLFGRVGWS